MEDFSKFVEIIGTNNEDKVNEEELVIIDKNEGNEFGRVVEYEEPEVTTVTVSELKKEKEKEDPRIIEMNKKDIEAREDAKMLQQLNEKYSRKDDEEEEESSLEATSKLKKIRNLQGKTGEETEKFKGFRDKMLDILRRTLGQMYNGVLVERRISCRRGSPFLYRRSYSPDLRELRRIMIDNAMEIRKKVGKDNYELLVKIFNKINKAREGTREYDEAPTKVTEIEFEKHLVVTKGYEYSIVEISSIEVNSNGDISLKNSEGEEVSIKTIDELRLMYRYSEEIIKALEEGYEFVKDRRKGQIETLEELKEMCGDHLICSS